MGGWDDCWGAVEDDHTWVGWCKKRKKVKARIIPVDILLQPLVKLILNEVFRWASNSWTGHHNWQSSHQNWRLAFLIFHCSQNICLLIYQMGMVCLVNLVTLVSLVTLVLLVTLHNIVQFCKSSVPSSASIWMEFQLSFWGNNSFGVTSIKICFNITFISCSTSSHLGM